MILPPLINHIFALKIFFPKENTLTINLMRNIGIIGLSNVGSTVTYTPITKGIADELVLIDQNDALCNAEYYDYSDSLGRLDTYTKLIKQDYRALSDAKIVVTSFGDIKLLADGGNRFLEYTFNCS